jgi:hypothetical protein
MRNFLKTYKEEIIAIPIIAIALIVLRAVIMYLFPDSALFDLPSEFESILFATLKLIIFTSITWLGLRIVFPAIFKYLKNVFYKYFDLGTDQEKRKISLIVFFGFLFALVFLSKGYSQTDNRAILVDNLHKQLNVREATGNNDGYMVKQYLNSVGLSEGYAWCAAFCTYNLNAIDVDNPKSAWSPDWSKKKDRIKKQSAKPGDCFTIYNYRLKRVAHVGFVIGRSTDGYFITIEGNTNSGGSRNGDGVYKRKRHPNKVYSITRYIRNET